MLERFRTEDLAPGKTSYFEVRASRRPYIEGRWAIFINLHLGDGNQAAMYSFRFQIEVAVPPAERSGLLRAAIAHEVAVWCRKMCDGDVGAGRKMRGGDLPHEALKLYAKLATVWWDDGPPTDTDGSGQTNK